MVEIHADRGSVGAYKIDQVDMINNQGGSLERRWQEPARQLFEDRRPFVGRESELEKAVVCLMKGEDVAIVGKERALTVALQGMAGIGKTYLARKLAVDLYEHFEHRVIWLDLRVKPHVAGDEQLLLGQLARYAFGGVVPPGQLDANQVRDWLQEAVRPPARFLVIFDDAWPQGPLRLINKALPLNAVRLITTRNRMAVQNICRNENIIPLDRLSAQDGRILLADRLGCQEETISMVDLDELVELLDGHALALEIAAAQIREPAWITDVLQALRDGIGQGRLDHLHVQEDRDLNLERSLALSYDRMTEEQRRRFRALGVFAAETPIIAEAAAAIWGLDGEHALQGQEAYQDDLSWALSSFASALDNLDRAEEALNAYAQAIALQPGASPLLRNRAETLIHLRRLADAEADLTRAVELDGDEKSPYLWFRRAQIGLARGDSITAERMLDAVIQRDATSDVVLERAQCAWLRGDQATAQELLQKVLKSARSGSRAVIRRDLDLLQREHPDLPPLDAF
jgi:tetratricopeptide (TPR) repeat protein